MMDSLAIWHGIGNIAAGIGVLAMVLATSHDIGFQTEPKDSKSTNWLTFLVAIVFFCWSIWWVGRWW